MATHPYFKWNESPHPFLLLAGLLIAVVLGVSLPSWPRILGVLNNAAHAPVFGAFALIALRVARGWRRRATTRAGDYALAFLVAIGIGGLVEIAQGFMERDASLEDWGTDALGAGCALGLGAALDRRLWEAGTRHAGQSVVAALGLFCGLWALLPVGQAAIAYTERASAFPVVARFSAPRDLYFISSGTARLSLQLLPARWARSGDAMSVRVDFTAPVWPGISHNEPQPDWRGFSALNLDVTNPQETPLRLTVRVHDLAHNQRYDDRFNRAFEAQPLSRLVLRIPIEAILNGPVNRRLDLARIAGIVVFESSRAAPIGGSFYLSRIWLD